MVDVVVGNSIPEMDIHWEPRMEELDAEALVENAVKEVIQGQFLHTVLKETAAECKVPRDTAVERIQEQADSEHTSSSALHHPAGCVNRTT